jgi:hypothetical protein
MDILALVFTLAMGVIAVAVVNSPALAGADLRRERYARHGILRPGDAPDADAPQGFVQRETRAERLALIGSAVLVAAAAAALVVVGPPDFQALPFLLLCAALVGRSVVLAFLAAREAATQGTPGPRVSHGRIRGVASRVPARAWALVTVAQVAFLALYVPQSGALRPELQGWVVGVAVLSLLDANELAWSDAARAAQLTSLLGAGPQLALGVMVSAFVPGDGPARDSVGSLPLLAWAYLGLTILVAVLTAARRGRNRAKAEHARR